MWSEAQRRGWITSDQVGRGLIVDEQGVVHWNPSGALYVAPDGSAALLTDGTTMVQTPSSPVALKSVVTPQQVAKIDEMVVAEAARAADTRDTLTSVATALNSEVVNRQGADLAQPQTFTTDGVVSFSLSPKVFVLIDNTGGDVTVDVAPFAGYEVNVKVTGYSGGNVCKLRPTTGNIETLGSIDYTAVLDSARYLCDGTDWWRIQ